MNRSNINGQTQLLLAQHANQCCEGVGAKPQSRDLHLKNEELDISAQLDNGIITMRENHPTDEHYTIQYDQQYQPNHHLNMLNPFDTDQVVFPQEQLHIQARTISFSDNPKHLGQF